MAQPYKNAVYVLVGLLALLILVNIFMIMPRTRMEPVEPMVSSREVQPDIIAKDNIMSVNTLQAIKQSKSAEQESPLYSEEEFSRNPFFWPDEMDKKVGKKIITTKKAAPKKPQLSMIMISEHQKQALLDDVFVTEGGTFHDYRVKRITNREVVLEGDLGDIHIALAIGGKDGKAKPETAEIGIIER
jgi:hypothetical protein